MPWVTPTLKQVRAFIRDDISSSLQGARVLGNSALRIVADGQASLAHMILQYLDWLANQLMPDTAESVWLERHGRIWLVNADGSLGRKDAENSTGTVTLT